MLDDLLFLLRRGMVIRWLQMKMAYYRVGIAYYKTRHWTDFNLHPKVNWLRLKIFYYGRLARHLEKVYGMVGVFYYEVISWYLSPRMNWHRLKIWWEERIGKREE